MASVPLQRRFADVLALTNMKPRGRGYGVKGSPHTVFWPDYDSYDLGALEGMLYGDGNLIKREELPYGLENGESNFVKGTWELYNRTGA